MSAAFNTIALLYWALIFLALALTVEWVANRVARWWRREKAVSRLEHHHVREVEPLFDWTKEEGL